MVDCFLGLWVFVAFVIGFGRCWVGLRFACVGLLYFRFCLVLSCLFICGRGLFVFTSIIAYDYYFGL